MKKEKIDLLLINPHKQNKIGIFTLAACIREKGYSVRIIGGFFEEIIREFEKYEPSMVGITATTLDAELAYQVCDYIKKKNSKIYCMLGGFHATAIPERVLKESKFDLLVVGEGEETLAELMPPLLKNTFPTKVPGTVEKDKDSIIFNPPREFIKDLDALPFPAFDLVNIEDYFHDIRFSFGHCKRSLCIVASRECPFDCKFCSSKLIWKRKLRFYSNDYLFKLINKLVEDYNLDGISFLDDEFVCHKERIYDFCDRMVKTGLNKKIKFACQGTAGATTEELLLKLKEAGCVLYRIGMESANQETLNFLKNSYQKVEGNLNAVNLCKKVGMPIFGNFIIGAPDEDLNSIVDTINFIENSKMNVADIFIATPFPNSDLYKICEERGYLKDNITWKDYTCDPKSDKTNAISRTKYFTAEQLSNIRKYLYNNILNYYNKNKPYKKLDHRKEIEKILNGNLSKCKKPFSQKLIASLNNWMIDLKKIKNLRKVKRKILNTIYHFKLKI